MSPITLVFLRGLRGKGKLLNARHFDGGAFRRPVVLFYFFASRARESPLVRLGYSPVIYSSGFWPTSVMP